jgi:hypothetical protein
LEAKKKEESKVGNWAPSEIGKGTSRTGFLCCNKSSGTSCQPFPECCNCKNKKKVMEGGENANNNDSELKVDNIPIVEILKN